MKRFLFLGIIALCATIGLCFAKTTYSRSTKTDLDLTRFSATMVYAEVFNMMMEPENYEGKTIKMRGNFCVFEYDEFGKTERTFACIIQDATACCAQGIAFTLAGNPTYPNDYPQNGEEIILTGKFHHYEKDGLDYTELIDCTLS